MLTRWSAIAIQSMKQRQNTTNELPKTFGVFRLSSAENILGFPGRFCATFEKKQFSKYLISERPEGISHIFVDSGARQL